jgi:hypothetical protein
MFLNNIVFLFLVENFMEILQIQNIQLNCIHLVNKIVVDTGDFSSLVYISSFII